ncbi:MAG: 30S ribosomal protein S20 [Rickettsiaceae bacterium]|nr:30S ribosomal protein S20 [Rickettsiaceae bacterium]
MANHASAKKAHRQTEKRTLENKSRMSRIKTFIKKVLAAIESGSKEQATEALRVAQSEIMRGVKANVIKLNAASRKVGRLAKKVKEAN